MNRGILHLIAVLLAVLCAGCASEGERAESGVLDGVPVSDELAAHLEASRSIPADAGDPLVRGHLRLYEDLTAAIQDPALRGAAGDSLYAVWRADPYNVLWIDLAAGYNYLLRRNTDRNAMYALPALADTSTALGSFVRGRRFYGYGSRGEHYRRAGRLADALDPLQRGDPIAAGRAFRACVEMADKEDRPDQAAVSRFLLGHLMLEQGRHEEALELFAPTAEDPAFGGRFRTRLTSRLYRGMALSGLGESAAAEQALASALSICTPRTPPDLVARLHLELGRALAGRERWREAEESLERARQLAWTTDADGSLEEIRHVGWDLRRDIVEATTALEMTRTAGRPRNDRIRELLELVLSLDRVDGAMPDVRSPADGMTLVYFVGGRHSFRWAGADARWVLTVLPPRRGMADLAAPVLADLGSPNRSVAEGPLSDLSRMLLEGIDPPADGARLSVVPDGILHLVPWPALRFDDGSDVLDRATLVILADPTRMARTAPATTDGLLLAVGVDGDVGASDDGLDTLRRAEAEATDIAASWPGEAVLKTGTEGGWGALAPSALGEYDVIHIASHAVAHAGADGGSTLRIAGTVGTEPLTTPTVRALDLRADLVYLSCCEAAASAKGAGGGVDDFAHAFLGAGAEAVIASTVRVDDEAAAHLARSFYEAYGNGASPEDALRSAQISLRNEKGRPWGHPYYWSSYRVVR